MAVQSQVLHPSASAFRLAPLASAVVALGLAGCGGTVTDNSAPVASNSGVSVAASFPTGLSVGLPTGVSAPPAPASTARAPMGRRYVADFGRALRTAWQQDDARTLGRLASALLPMGSALAATAVEPSLKSDAATIEKVASGDPSVDLSGLINLGQLFGDGHNAGCYGPTMRYAGHDDGADASPAQLPSGDLGLWLATEAGTSQPCITAQLNARVSGVKGRGQQGLLLMAVMRDAATTLPVAGASLDVKTALQSMFALVPALSSVTIDAATVALDTGGATYTYRLVLSKGTGAGAVSGEVILKHTPGSGSSAYTGVLQVAGFQLSNDPAFSCPDETDAGTGLYKVAQVSTLKYSRAVDVIEFGSRDGRYCGHASATDATHPTDYAAQVAGFTSDGQIDPAVKLSGTARAGTKGWRAGFTRFAGTFHRTTVAGNFLFAWQAGSGDSHSRALAAHADFNSATETRTVDGYFAFAGDVATTDGTLLGMVCNWAGPGNSHSPSAKFQSQTATLSPSAIGYVLGASKIAYAPTRSCSASATMNFDVNADATLTAGEGASTVDALDTPTGANTVQQEIDMRGFVKPGMF